MEKNSKENIETKTPNEMYMEWIDWSKKNVNQELPLLTNTQVRFAMFLFENKEMVSKIGNLDLVYKSIRKFLKS